MLDMEDNIYKNKNAIIAAIGIMKSMRKVENIKEEEVKTFKIEFDNYKESVEFKKMVEDLKKREEDEDFKNDFDP